MSTLVNKLFEKLTEKNWTIVTAESCTGGIIATLITDKVGASLVLDRGFVTYSNKAKMDCLGVPEIMLSSYGAVSMEVAEKMASGALKNSQANVSVSVTGIAGPDGGTTKKPVGLVFIGYALKGGVVQATRHQFEGTREEIRLQAARAAFTHVISIIE